MIILFGTRSMQKQYNVCQQEVCGVCGKEIGAQLVQNSTWFTLFFIPVVKITSKYYFRCPMCGAVKEVSKKVAKDLINSRNNIDTIEVK